MIITNCPSVNVRVLAVAAVLSLLLCGTPAPAVAALFGAQAGVQAFEAGESSDGGDGVVFATAAAGGGVAHADLASGTLGVLAASGHVNTSASFFDTVTVVPTGGVLATTTLATVRLTVDGILLGTNATAGFSVQTGGIREAVCLESSGAIVPSACELVSSFEKTLSRDVFVDLSSPSFLLAVTLLANASSGSVADISNTARLSLILEPGFTFTSASGVLLSQVDGVAPVPEPSTLALLASTALLALVTATVRQLHRRPTRMTIPT
jgi:hypothetical protein